VIFNVNTLDHNVIEIESPRDCASSQHYVSVTTSENELRLFSFDGTLVHIVPDSVNTGCVAFHPDNSNIMAIGYKDGMVRMWNVSMREYVSSFNTHTYAISRVRFTPDNRMFLSSWDNTASMIELDDHLKMKSSIKLKGHFLWVTDILPLTSSNQCVTCSHDKTIKVWDCQTGSCLRTLAEHISIVTSLALPSSEQYFASGSYDESVIIWSTETFEVLRRITFPHWVQSLAFGKHDTLYAGVYGRGVLSCNVRTGEVGSVMIPAREIVSSLSLGKALCHAPHKHTTHSLS
jgi:WD40 repeat protein